MALSNSEVYRRTIGFSLWRLLWDVIAVVVFVGLMVLGFVIGESATNLGLAGLAVGALLGAVVLYFLLRYVGYTYGAGQIAMMTKGVTEGKLPDDTISAGKAIVKERFSTVAGYYVATGLIKGVFQQIGNGITAVGQAIGGDNGGAIGGTISGIIQTVVAYLCDCCLGWVFYRKDMSAPRATCEGAVIFFKHGKTLAKNLGRVFGIGIVSLLVIGGIFSGIFYLILMNFPDLFAGISTEIAQIVSDGGNEVPEILNNITTLTWVVSIIGGVVMWSILHSTFVRPFILVGVLRNFMKSGIEDMPDEKSFDELDKKSKKFKELHEKALTA